MRSARSDAGRPIEAGVARRAIVDAADALFYERGIKAVSLSGIAARAGVSRRTLYYHFAGKDDLVVAHLTARDEATRAQLRAAPSILAVFRSIERLFCDRDYRGCALTNALFENGGTSVVVGRITTAYKRALLAWFVEAAARTGAAEPRALGEALMLVFEGLMLSARTRREPRLVDIACDAAARLITSYGGAP